MITPTLKQRLVVIVVAVTAIYALNLYLRSPSVLNVIDPDKRLRPIAIALPALQSSSIDDKAGLLGEFTHHLHRVAQDWRDSLGIEVQIITLQAPDEKIAELANRLFRQRNIGRASPTGGVLILMESGQQAARIEVSYSLEAVFPDAIVGLLAHDQLAPYASYQIAGMAIMDVLHFMKDRALEQAILGGLALHETFRNGAAYQVKQAQLSGGAGAQVKLTDVPTDVDFKRPVRPNDLPRYLPADTPEESIEAYKRSLKNYVGDPDLPLFTEGSKLMRMHYPFAPYEELLRLQRLVASEPLRIITKNQYAVAVSDKPAHGFSPLLLKNIDGKWHIDMVEVWKNIFFDPDGNYFLNNNNTTYAFGLTQFGEGRYHELSSLPVAEGRLRLALEKLQGKDDAMSLFLRAELLFRNAFTALEALKYYQRALAVAPEDPLIQSTFVDRVMYLGFPELAIPVLKHMGVPGSLRLAEALVHAQHPALAIEAARLSVNDNPYSLQALRTLKWTLEQAGQKQEAQQVQRQITRLRNDSKKRYQPVWLSFHPKAPLLRTRQPTIVGDRTVYRHSQFSVTITNYSDRPVNILSVQLVSAGTAATSGLGDIKDYWQIPNPDYLLARGESRWFDKTWGFTLDPGHDRLSYIFHVCWRGEDEQADQCNTQTLHLTTDVYALWDETEPFQGTELEGLWYESNRINSQWVLKIVKFATEYEGRYEQLSGVNIRFQKDDLVLKGQLNEQGKLQGHVLLKYDDDIKKSCANAKDHWVPITFDVVLNNTRLKGHWQGTEIFPNEGCREQPMKKVSYVLDKLSE